MNKQQWRVDVRSHRIRDVIEYILKQPETEFPLPECVVEDPACSDCALWDYFDHRDSSESSSSSGKTSSSTLPSTTTSTKTSTNIPEPPGDPWRTHH